MKRNKRYYPIDEARFNSLILPIIAANYIRKGRPPKISHYKAFCWILYILRTGLPWRDLPAEFGHWHTVYDRFNRGNERGLWEKALMALQKGRGPCPDEVIIDTMKVHRHGGGQKGGFRAKACPERV